MKLSYWFGGASSLVLFSLTAFSTPTLSQSFDLKSIKKVKIINDSGKVTLSKGKGLRANIKASKIKFSDENCLLRMQSEGQTLLIEAKSKSSGRSKSFQCQVNFDVTLPKALALDLHIGQGDIIGHGIEGEVNFNSGTGEVKLQGLLNRVSGKVGNGHISLNGLNGNTKLNLGSGSIGLSYPSPSAKGILDIKSGNGDITLSLHPQSKVKTHFMSGNGKIHSAFADSNDAKLEIFAVSGNGNLTLKKHMN